MVQAKSRVVDEHLDWEFFTCEAFTHCANTRGILQICLKDLARDAANLEIMCSFFQPFTRTGYQNKCTASFGQGLGEC